MTIWILIIEDRHIEPDARPYSRMDLAIEAARQWASDLPNVTDVELDEDMIRDGWVYCLEYGTEGDSVRVVERELDGPLPT